MVLIEKVADKAPCKFGLCNHSTLDKCLYFSAHLASENLVFLLFHILLLRLSYIYLLNLSQNLLSTNNHLNVNKFYPNLS